MPRILEAARQATWMGARGKELLPDLVALLGHAEVDVRAAVVAAIGRVGGDDAMPLLVGALGDAAATVRVAALDQLRVIDKKFAATVFAPIANCIGDADGKVRKAAVQALGATALRDRSFQRELEHHVQILLADTVPAVRIAAAEALTELDHLNAATLATLVPLLDDVEPLVRLAGVRALRAAGAAAASHATRVLELGRAGDPAMAGAALRALAAIAPDREDAWWFAVERLQDRAFVGAAQADAAYLLLGL